MEKENIYGLMEENIKVNINKIKNMDTELIHGRMEENIKEIGLMESKKGLENISQLMENLSKEFGKTEKDKNGSFLINKEQRKKTSMREMFESRKWNIYN